MSEPIWSSEAVRTTNVVCFDVKVNKGLVLGVFIGEGEAATDYHMTSDKARAIARILNEGADRSDEAAQGQS